jgi:hypothetical protein
MCPLTERQDGSGHRQLREYFHVDLIFDTGVEEKKER